MLRYWLLAVRPKTLTIAVMPVLLGSALAWAQAGSLSWLVLAAALTGAVLIQVGTNLHNDAADFARGADNPDTRLGPPRASAEGWLEPVQVHRAAFASFGLAALAGSYLVWIGGWPILFIGVASIAAGLAYTGGPFPVAYSALGELFVWLFFGLVAVVATCFLHTGVVHAAAVLAGALLGLPAAAVLVVNNYRDRDNDRAAGRRTLAVRIGRAASQWEYAALMLLPFLLLMPLAMLATVGWGLALPLLTLPWALSLVWRFRTQPPGMVFNGILAATARFQFIFGLLLCAGLLIPGLFGTAT